MTCSSDCANCELDCLALHGTDPETQEYLRLAISSIANTEITVQKTLDNYEEKEDGQDL